MPKSCSLSESLNIQSSALEEHTSKMGGGEGEPGVLIFADLKLGFGTINRLIIHHSNVIAILTLLYAIWRFRKYQYQGM